MTDSTPENSRHEALPQESDELEAIQDDHIGKSRRRFIGRAAVTTAITMALILTLSYESSEPIDPPAPPTPTATQTIEPTPVPSATPIEAPVAEPVVPELIPDVAQEVQAYPDSRFETYASWVQDFSKMENGSPSDKSWNVTTGHSVANEEKQYYTNSLDNVRIENGVLMLEARPQIVGGYLYTSGKIDTLGKEDFLYGKIEIQAKLPVGVGTWAAIWMTPSEHKYAGSPIPEGANQYAVDGELDIAETTGIDPNEIYCVAHALQKPIDSPYPNRYYSTLEVPDSHTAFHNYGVSWTPDEIIFTVDGAECYSVKKNASDAYLQWPYDQPYNLIVNLAIGGSWVAGDPSQYPPDGIDQSMFPVSVQVASVKYFPLVQ